jgi:hypothetical protein
MKDFIPCIILAILYLVFYHVLAADAGQLMAREVASLSSDSRQVKSICVGHLCATCVQIVCQLCANCVTIVCKL